MKQIPLRPVLIGLVVLVAAVGLTRIVPSSNDVPSSTVVPSGSASPNNAATSGAFDGQCQKDRPGVTLIVDFGTDAGRDPLVRCARGFNVVGSSVSNELNGWQLFSAVGVDVAGTTEYPVGFVCRVDGFPLKAEQPCTSTPSYAEGYWAYFYAQLADGLHPNDGFGNVNSGKWRFSATGSAQHKPRCGGVEGWLFVKGNETTGTMTSTQPSVQPKAFSCRP